MKWAQEAPGWPQVGMVGEDGRNVEVTLSNEHLDVVGIEATGRISVGRLKRNGVVGLTAREAWKVAGLLVIGALRTKIRTKLASLPVDVRYAGPLHTFEPLDYREVPLKITCPECGSGTLRCDGEGACQCDKGHRFWDTNAPEWLAIRERQREAAYTRKHGDPWLPSGGLDS